MAEESAAARYARDYGAMATNDPDRKTRTLDEQSDERLARRYVAQDFTEGEPYSGTSATGASYDPS